MNTILNAQHNRLTTMPPGLLPHEQKFFMAAETCSTGFFVGGLLSLLPLFYHVYHYDQPHASTFITGSLYNTAIFIGGFVSTQYVMYRFTVKQQNER